MRGCLASQAFDPGVFVGGVVVHDQVQLAIRRGLRVDLFEEAQPFLMAMPGLAARCHRVW